MALSKIPLVIHSSDRTINETAGDFRVFLPTPTSIPFSSIKLEGVYIPTSPNNFLFLEVGNLLPNAFVTSPTGGNYRTAYPLYFNPSNGVTMSADCSNTYEVPYIPGTNTVNVRLRDPLTLEVINPIGEWYIVFSCTIAQPNLILPH